MQRRQFKKENEPYKDAMFLARLEIFEPSATEQQRTVRAEHVRFLLAGSQAEADSIFAATVQKECAEARIRLSEWKCEGWF